MKIIKFEKSVSYVFGSSRRKRVRFSDSSKSYDGAKPINQLFINIFEGYFGGSVKTADDIREIESDSDKLYVIADMIYALIMRMGTECNGYNMIPILLDGSSSAKVGLRHIKWVIKLKEMILSILD